MFRRLSERLRSLTSKRSTTVELDYIALLAPLAAEIGEEAFEEALSRSLTPDEQITSPSSMLDESRNRSHLMAEQAKREGRIEDALELWLVVLAIDACGQACAKLDDEFNLHWIWSDRPIAHGIVRRTAKAANALGFGMMEIERRFRRLAERIEVAAARLGSTAVVDRMWAINQPHLQEMLAMGISFRRRTHGLLIKIIP